MSGEAETLLEVRDLRTYFRGERSGAGEVPVAKAVDGISFDLRAGETLALVGESGCGKSVTALSILGLVEPPGFHAGGEVRLRGQDLVRLPKSKLQALRGNEIAMIFQEPMTALNPVFTVGEQIAEVARLHLGLDKRAARARAIEMLERVRLPDAASRVDAYPHQLSGGMRQRVMIAMAMCCNPSVLIADEPTTALDVTVQAEILGLLRELQEESGLALLLITHDLAVVSEVADRAIVMYAGRIAEVADAEALFARPMHPYTAGLMRSLPEMAVPGERLAAIPGAVPSAFEFPMGCRFQDRCELVSEACFRFDPDLFKELGSDHAVACHHPGEAQR